MNLCRSCKHPPEYHNEFKRCFVWIGWKFCNCSGWEEDKQK